MKVIKEKLHKASPLKANGYGYDLPEDGGNGKTTNSGVSSPSQGISRNWTGNEFGGVVLGEGNTFNPSESPIFPPAPVRSVNETTPTVFTYTCRPTYMEEKHMTVIRKGPTAPPTLEMYSYTQSDINGPGGVPDGVVDVIGVMQGITNDILNSNGQPNIPGSVFDDSDKYPNGTNYSGVSKLYQDDGITRGERYLNTSIFYNEFGNRYTPGDEVVLNIFPNESGEDWKLGDTLTISGQYFNSFGVQKGCGVTGIITSMASPTTLGPGFDGVKIRILSISPSTPKLIGPNDIYTVRFLDKQPIFEYKFPRFAYRYKYEDGEYSVFSPWSEIAFIPEDFDYLPKKGYNLGMTNRVRSLEIQDFVPKNIPKDVIQVDLLYKESNSPNVYTVESFKKNDPLPDSSSLYNYWNTPATGGNFGKYIVTSELIHATLPSNQMLRPWDNVPRKALGQEVTANRLIYANYLQNYSTIDTLGAPIKPIFSVNVDSTDISTVLGGEDYIGKPAKSLKTMRTYQLGVVYRDKYGRETPVLTSKSGSIHLRKDQSYKFNRLSVSLNDSGNGEANYPEWAESYTFYIKETSNEYYNASMDRWYNADDGNVWLSFPSSERNKINDDTILILKKEHDTHTPVTEDTRYKVVSIKNNAPTFIKTENQYWGSLAMMLPPPGWGGSGKPGGWQSGMFSPSGLPLPKHQYLDIYAEYWDQSVFSDLEKKPTCQVRIVQAPGMPSAYTASGNTVTNYSQWYDVANISHIGQPPEVVEEETYNYDSSGNIIGSTIEEVEQAATETQLVRLTLEKILGNDVGFTQAHDNLDLSRGLMLEARTQIIKDKSQFEGRFFVKVERDATIENHIIAPQTKDVTNWQVLQSKDVSYVCAAHPGRQDWNHSVYVGYQGESVNAFDILNNSQSATSGVTANSPAVHAPNNGTTPRLISSYHNKAGTGAPVYTSGTILGNNYPQGTSVWNDGSDILWPLGPGNQELEVYKDILLSTSFSPPIPAGGWLTDEWATVIGVKGRATTMSGTTQSTWPSYFPSSFLPGFDKNPSTGTIFTQAGQFDASIVATTNDDDVVSPIEWDGINHSNMSAIWDRGDGRHGGDPQNYDMDTIWKLGGAWYDLAAGRRMNGDWPLTSTWKRWFIDKAGAAQGYSGAGIYDNSTGQVSKMDVSYYGMGYTNNIGSRSHDLAEYQPDELVFAEAMGTTGTSFRFKQDPDQIVYTITNAEISGRGGVETIYNYEAPCGTWGYVDGIDNPGGTDNDGWGPNDGSLTGMAKRGNGCAEGLWPSYGSKNKNTGSWAGKPAFMSDFLLGGQEGVAWNARTLYSGGSPFNRRVRYTVTLDKKIGDGPSAFHPITNHVDSSGESNIQAENITKANYDVNSTDNGNGSATVRNGATPSGKRFFNLNSYWNANDGAGGGETEQPSSKNDTFYTTNTDAYIGLHERGLNYTTIEIVSQYSGDEGDRPMSNNPAVWETEPKEDVGLDIYKAASPSYPINLKRWRTEENSDPLENTWYDYSDRGEEYIPVGSSCRIKGGSGLSSVVDGVSGNLIFLNSFIYESTPGVGAQIPFVDANNNPTKFIFEWGGEGSWYGAYEDKMFVEATIKQSYSNNFNILEIQPIVHSERKLLSYFNCYSFANGVESNRIRDDYNAVQIDKGVKASMPLAEQYEEEHRPSSLIFSGIYNSTSGVNRLNQFIQAEPITKDLNPINGSIQKLYARDTNLVTFCENKVFKILAKKDALFNADGNTNVTATQKVLGQTVPFTGEYGISTDPSSFAAESYRMYFTDKAKGAVLRLSRDGITNISDYGMKDWFQDNLRFAKRIAGSFDDKKDEYNLTIESWDVPSINSSLGETESSTAPAYTVSFTESRKGWVSFKSFIHQDGFSHKNNYYTFPSNHYNRGGGDTSLVNLLKSPLGFQYGSNIGNAEFWKHHQDIEIKALLTEEVENDNELTVKMFNVSWLASDYVIIPGMVVSGNGIPIDTTVVSITSSMAAGGGVGSTGEAVVILSNNVWIYDNEEITFTSSRNNFYGTPAFSSVTVMFNGDQGSVKRFRTLNYEGTQAEVTYRPNNHFYLYDTNGAPLFSTAFNWEPSIDPNTKVATYPEGTQVGQEYYDNWPKDGWRVEELKTDLQHGQLAEFIDKENKWFNYIRGFEDAKDGDNIDTAEFSAQGLGRQFSIFTTPGTQGCMDATALNYEQAASFPCYGCCVYTEGCLDPLATNYDPTAETACTGCCQFISGCMDILAFNYNPSAVQDDGSCIYCVDGCTDENATNYDASATCDDGSCAYVQGCTDTTVPDGCGVGCNGALNQDCIGGSSYPSPNPSNGSNTNPGCTDNVSQDNGSCVWCVWGCTDAIANNYNSLATCDDGETCDFCVYGCTDVSSTNYNASATCDDGSCYTSGCTDPGASNFNLNATLNDGTCLTCNCSGANCCTDEEAYNYNPGVNCDCNGEAIGTEKPGWDSCCEAIVCGCPDTQAVNWNDNCNGTPTHGSNSDPHPNTKCNAGIGHCIGEFDICEYPDVTPDTYIRIIQDISASMSAITTPLKNAIVGVYGTQYCLRTDLQDIYANHPDWIQGNCGGSVGVSGCSDNGNCTKACDPTYNGKEAYEAHVSHIEAWEYPAAYLANISPLHNHPLNGVDQVIGGYFGNSGGILAAAGQSGDPDTTQENIQANMNEGLTTFQSPIEKVFMISVGDEVNPHYRTPLGTVADAAAGCDGGGGGGSNWPSSPSYAAYSILNNPLGLTLNSNNDQSVSVTHGINCGDLSKHGPKRWSGLPTSNPAFNQDKSEGSTALDIGYLRNQLQLVQTAGTIEYGGCFLSIVHKDTGAHPVNQLAMEKILGCIVTGDVDGTDCTAFGDFTDTVFSEDGYPDIRNIADFNYWSNSGNGKITIANESMDLRTSTTVQQDIYNKLISIFNIHFGITI